MTADACRDRRGDIAALALGREDTRAQAHVDGCPECRAALVELRRTSSLLPLVDLAHLSVGPAPPADLATRILRDVRVERAAARRSHRRRRLAVSLAAAGALVVAALAGVLIALPDDRGTTELQAFTTAAPGVTGRFGLEANGQGTVVRLAHDGLEPAAIYWLWLTDDGGRRVSAGTFLGAEGDDELVLQGALPLEDAVRVWVTDERDAVVLDATLP